MNMNQRQTPVLYYLPFNAYMVSAEAGNVTGKFIKIYREEHDDYVPVIAFTVKEFSWLNGKGGAVHYLKATVEFLQHFEMHYANICTMMQAHAALSMSPERIKVVEASTEERNHSIDELTAKLENPNLPELQKSIITQTIQALHTIGEVHSKRNQE